MALTNLQANITLDVYDHDGAKPSIKTIALDDNTRYVLANIRSRGEVYDIGSSATVQLIVIRPDKVGVQIAGQAQGIEIGQEDESVVTVYGAYAELDQAAIVLPGTLLGQFKITSGDQILRTQIFQILNGEALDSDTWAGDYDGYNLEEMATSIETNTADIVTLEADVSQIKEDLSDVEDRVEALEQGGTGGGLTEAVKVALLQIAQKVAYIDADGQDYYDDLYDALYPPASLVSISAVYSGGAVTDDTPLNALKTDLTVTASYDDSTTAIVTDYTLSGTLSVGTSTITVSYGGKTTTFTVTVTHAITEELWIDGLATGSTAGFNFAPFVLPASTYEYDYTKSITAIETEFVSAGVISVGYYSGTVDTQTVPSDSDTHIHEVLTVSATGQHKLSLSTPMSIPSGAVLLVGQSTDTATFKYGGTLTNGFAYRDVNGQHYFKFQSKKLGINVYRQ